MKFTNKSGLPEHLFRVIVHAYEADRARYGAERIFGTRDISVTELISPPQKLALERKNADKLEIDVLDAVPALLGTAMHHVLELSGKEMGDAHIAERRLSTYFNGWTISGKSDVYLTGNGKLIDYKQSSVWAYIFGKREWDAQLNVLRWIIVRNGGHVSSLEVDLFVSDWRRGESKRDEKYPPRVVVMPIKMWTIEETERFIIERLALHGAEIPPPCSSEDRWQKPTSYAVKKRGALRATKVFPEEIQAEDFAKTVAGSFIEKRPGEATRCLDYCAAAPFCRQWNADPTNPVNNQGVLCPE